MYGGETTFTSGGYLGTDDYKVISIALYMYYGSIYCEGGYLKASAACSSGTEKTRFAYGIFSMSSGASEYVYPITIGKQLEEGQDAGSVTVECEAGTVSGDDSISAGVYKQYGYRENKNPSLTQYYGEFIATSKTKESAKESYGLFTAYAEILGGVFTATSGSVSNSGNSAGVRAYRFNYSSDEESEINSGAVSADSSTYGIALTYSNSSYDDYAGHFQITTGTLNINCGTQTNKGNAYGIAGCDIQFGSDSDATKKPTTNIQVANGASCYGLYGYLINTEDAQVGFFGGNVTIENAAATSGDNYCVYSTNNDQ